jgi:alkylhydroperoxidase family enzyme
MAYIGYVNPNDIPKEDLVTTDDNILLIHGVHPKIMQKHYALYKELMYSKGSISRKRRELIAVVVSSLNSCHY